MAELWIPRPARRFRPRISSGWRPARRSRRRRGEDLDPLSDVAGRRGRDDGRGLRRACPRRRDVDAGGKGRASADIDELVALFGRARPRPRRGFRGREEPAEAAAPLVRRQPRLHFCRLRARVSIREVWLPRTAVRPYPSRSRPLGTRASKNSSRSTPAGMSAATSAMRRSPRARPGRPRSHAPRYACQFGRLASTSSVGAWTPCAASSAALECFGLWVPAPPASPHVALDAFHAVCGGRAVRPREEDRSRRVVWAGGTVLPWGVRQRRSVVPEGMETR